MIEVVVNGKTKNIERELNLRDLLMTLEFPTERIAIELNRDVVRKKDWDEITLRAKDEIEIIHFVGGG